MRSTGFELHAEGCQSSLPWHQQMIRDKGTGLAGRRVQAQCRGKQLALALKASKHGDNAAGFMAIQARERWSTSEDMHYRPGHFWLAQAPDVVDVKKLEKRCKIQGITFSPGDYLVRIGRYFDRKASDPSGLTFEEKNPPPNQDSDGSFIINATELRAVNFSMLPAVGPLPLAEIRRSGRLAKVVITPPAPRASEYIMPQEIDNMIRASCR